VVIFHTLLFMKGAVVEIEQDAAASC